MSELKPLVIGDLVVEKPIIQGGMGVGISLHRLAGAVAKAGGMGIISAAQIGFREPDFTTNFVEANLRSIRREMKLAREIAPQGAIGFNIMVATKHYDMWVKEAVKAGADIIISGAGLPVSLPEYVEAAYAEMEKKPDRRIKLAPIVSSAKSAMVICKMWDRKCHIAPDLVVVAGPLAGGHLGFSLDQLSAYGADTSDVPATYDREAYLVTVQVTRTKNGTLETNLWAKREGKTEKADGIRFKNQYDAPKSQNSGSSDSGSHQSSVRPVQTGDAANIVVWFLAAVLAAGVIVLIVIGKKNRNREKKERIYRQRMSVYR